MRKKKKDAFNIGELVVYPKHGVGEIRSVSTLEISKIKTKYYIIQMEQDKLLIKVPLEKQNEILLNHSDYFYCNKCFSTKSILCRICQSSRY